jgi:acyl carrier protein
MLGELHGWAQDRLPDYMIPSALVILDALPLTPSGKVDRQALPAPDWSRRALDQTYVAPRTPIETEVAGLIVQVLGVERVGIHDNFFTLGGHSLLATQLVARLRDRFGLELPLRSLFEAPTVAGLAERVETIQWMAQGEEVPAGALGEDYEEGEI